MTAAPDSAAVKFKRLIRGFLAELLPEVAQGRHVPFRAKVRAVLPMAAGKSNALLPRYVATVQPLDAQGREDPRRPALTDVPIQTLWAGPNGEGLFRLPGIGSIVRVEFDYGDPSLPVIVGVLTEGQAVPAAALGDMVEQYGVGSWRRVSASGAVEERIPPAASYAVGNGTVELLDLVDQLIAQLDLLMTQLGLLTVTGVTSGGAVSGVPANAAAIAVIQVQVGVIKTALETLTA